MWAGPTPTAGARGARYRSGVAIDGARLFHVNLNCTDLERSRRFYVEALGLEVGARTAPDTVQPGAAFGLDRARWDAWILLGGQGYAGGAIDLLQWLEPTPTGGAPGSYHECGFQRIGFSVPDLDAVIERIDRLGGSVWHAPIEHTTGTPNPIRLVHASDPDGVVLEAFESPGSATSLSFVSVVCADLAMSLAWYEALGFRVLARFPTDRDDGSPMLLAGPVVMDEVLLAPPGGGSVHTILVGFGVPRSTRVASRPANAVGLWRAAYLVDDLDAAQAALDEAGVATLAPPVAMAMGPDLPELRFVCFRGPDGEVLELIETPAS